MLGVSPNLIGIIAIIQGATMILVMQPLFDADIGFSIFLNNAVCLECCIGMQKDMQCVLTVF